MVRGYLVRVYGRGYLFMHVKAKQAAVLGLLAAIISIILVLSAVIESNTLFFLAAASYLVGAAVREYGLRMGTAFFIACALLGFLLAPNKMYVVTFAGLSAYILMREAMYLLLLRMDIIKSKRIAFFLTKLAAFNLLYIPALLFLPQFLFAGDVSADLLAIFWAGGQAAWFVYDKAYDYFQTQIWGKFRARHIGT